MKFGDATQYKYRLRKVLNGTATRFDYKQLRSFANQMPVTEGSRFLAKVKRVYAFIVKKDKTVYE